MAQPQVIHPIAGEPVREKARNGGGRAEAYQAELDALMDRKRQRIEILERTEGPNSELYLRRKAQYMDGREGVASARVRVKNREIKKVQVAAYWYVAVALVFLAFEAPLNKFVFDVAFGSIGLYSWSGAVTLGLVIFVVAHFYGLALRQVWSESDRRLSVGKFFRICVCTAFLLAAVVSLAVARYKYSIVGAGTDLGALVGDLTSAQSTIGLLQVVRAAFSDTASQILAVANAGGILAAVIIAMISHDPDENLDAAARRLQRADKALKRLDKRYKSRLTEIGADFEPEIARLSDYIAAAKQRFGNSGAANDPI